jgi:small-conductance mechanosensitive channel
LQRSAAVAALEAELESLRAELASYDARQELLPARRDRAVRRVARAEQAENQWQGLVQTARSQEAARSAMEAERLRRDAASQSPMLSEFAMVSATLAKERASADGTPQKIAGVEQEIVTTQRRLAEMRRQYQEALRKLNASGLNRATGLLLRKQFESLPDLSDLKRRLSLTREALEEAEYTLVDRQEMRSGAGDIDAVVSELVGAAGGSDAVPDEFREAARELAIARRDLLNQLISDATTLFDRLLNLEEAESTLLLATEQYDDFIGERFCGFGASLGRGLVSRARTGMDWKRRLIRLGSGRR